MCKGQINDEGDDTSDKRRHFFSAADTDQLSTFWRIGEGILLILNSALHYFVLLMYTFLDSFLIYNY
jgi:hypothetical protein